MSIQRDKRRDARFILLLLAGMAFAGAFFVPGLRGPRWGEPADQLGLLEAIRVALDSVAWLLSALCLLVLRGQITSNSES